MDLNMETAVWCKSENSDTAESQCVNLPAKFKYQPAVTMLNVNKCSWRILKGKHWLLLVIIVLFLLCYANIEKGFRDENINVIHYSHVPGMKSYLVWSEHCKIPNIDSYEPEMMRFFKRQQYKPCSNLPPLTSVAYNDTTQRYVLQLHRDRLGAYTGHDVDNIDCCYEAVQRPTDGADIDSHVKFGACVRFYHNTALAPDIDSIIVSCYIGSDGARRESDKPFYANGHALMPERVELHERLQTWRHQSGAQEQRPSNVLMIGIDSVSRINLIRAMPKTAQYLYDNNWFEMSGYNKIDDNTFPNLMAILTGQNRTTTHSQCPPNVPGGLDNCTYIWDLFQKFGYVTAYSEDMASINTFNYCKLGFMRPPVDYYTRPYFLAAESKLRSKSGGDRKVCLGPQHSIEAVYDYALELVRRYPKDPYFGLFWTNSLSHDALSDCTALDKKMVDYLQRFAALGAFNNTVIVFFSDHGMRFGPTRKLYTAQYEERLPFLFIWLPPYLKQTHPEFVHALNVNKNRLTNPFDLHMTLRHVLALSGRVAPKDQPLLLQPIKDCPRCHTLLQPMAQNRSCSDAAIEDHWCTCIPFQNVYKKTKTIHRVAQLSVNYINNFVSTFNNGSFAKLCVPLHLGSIEHAYRAQPPSAALSNVDEGLASATIYRITFHTKPNQALFEATVRFNADTEELIVTGEISRLNSYSSDSSCMEDGAAKKYCSCQKRLI